MFLRIDRDHVRRAALGAAVSAIVGALLVGLFFIIMHGLDPGVFGIMARALQYTGLAAFLIGFPLHLVVRRFSSGLSGLILTGSLAGVALAALISHGERDIYLYLTAGFLGGFSAALAYPIVGRHHPQARAD